MKMIFNALLLALFIAACSSGKNPPPDESPMPAPIPEPTPVTVPGAWWKPGPIKSFQIMHFDSFSEFKKHLKKVDILTAELEQLEEIGKPALDYAHAQATKVICYTSMGYEEWRDDAKEYPKDAKGKDMEEWEGEAWGDPRKPSLLAFQGKRMDRAVALGCDGLEIDNIDTAWNTKENGFKITPAENIGAMKKYAELAHAKGLAIVQKNSPDMSSALAPFFDGLWSESCQQYSECEPHKAYKGKPVAFIEYKVSCKAYDWAVCHKQDDYFE